MNELYHHGILGMKWGVRRYQNKDGTLTEAGRRRLSKGTGANKVDFDDRGRIASGQESKAASRIRTELAGDYKNLSTVGSNAAQATRGARNIVDQSISRSRRREAAKIDVSDLTDKELQSFINRMNLERTYKNLTTEEVGAGRRYVSDILQTAGEVLAIGASVASIAMAINQMKS